MCLFCTIACGVWETLTGQQFQVKQFKWTKKVNLHNHFLFLQIYLPWAALVPTEPISGATVIALLVFFSYAIVLNTVVPISLYVRFVLKLKHNLCTYISSSEAVNLLFIFYRSG